MTPSEAGPAPAAYAGAAHVVGDNVDTDRIIPGKYTKTLDTSQLAIHLLEDYDPRLVSRLQAGDVLVAGENFGCGSSREQAPLAIAAAGISVVLARSFARIFFRNSINIGLPVLACDTDDIGSGDEIEIDLASGRVRNLSTGASKAVQPLPKVMMNVIADGGLVQHIRKHGTYMLD